MKLSISTNRVENILGYTYLLFCQLFLPSLISLAAHLLGYSMSLSVLNIVFFLVNFVSVAAIFHRFLWRSAQAAFQNLWRCLRCAVLGIGLYYAAMLLVDFLILQLDQDFSNVNDSFVADMAQEHTRLISFCTIFLVPVVEETLYRGLIFQQLHRKDRLLAYCVSCLIFAGIHILGYVGQFDRLTLFLCFVQYLPAGIALAWAYERSDTIIAPILMHITINQIGMSALR